MRPGVRALPGPQRRAGGLGAGARADRRAGAPAAGEQARRSAAPPAHRPRVRFAAGPPAHRPLRGGCVADRVPRRRAGRGALAAGPRGRRGAGRGRRGDRGPVSRRPRLSRRQADAPRLAAGLAPGALGLRALGAARDGGGPLWRGDVVYRHRQGDRPGNRGARGGPGPPAQPDSHRGALPPDRRGGWGPHRLCRSPARPQGAAAGRGGRALGARHGGSAGRAAPALSLRGERRARVLSTHVRRHRAPADRAGAPLRLPRAGRGSGPQALFQLPARSAPADAIDARSVIASRFRILAAMRRAVPIAPLLALATAPAAAQPSIAAQAGLLARARSLELNTPYLAPPGDPLEHHAAGFAKIMCSAVFITGLDPDFAAENVGYFTAPYEVRARLGKPLIDRGARAVYVAVPGGLRRTARHLGDQGCVTLPAGMDSVSFRPVRVATRLPPAATPPWPMGDAPSGDALPAEIDTARVRRAVDAAFEPAAGMTAAFVVTWKGRLIGERYGDGIGPHTPLESWSMGKSVTATLMGILVRQRAYDLWQPAPIPEWGSPGDPRAGIRIADLLRMSSGLRIRAPQDPDYDPAGPYPDHLYLYTGGVDMFRYAATRPLQWPPGSVGRYRNTDPVLVNYLVRLAVERRGEEYHSFPQRALFDKLGIRTMVLETDPYGNFLLQGYELASARDWARLGNLYLQDGVWNGERILPEGYVRFVSTVAPAWKDGGQPYYGGFFWLNTAGAWPVPRDAYYMAGSGTQITLMVPSHDLVVARLGHYRGAAAGAEGLRNALALLMEAVPRSK